MLVFRDIEKKAAGMVKKIEKQGQLNDQIKTSLMSAQTTEELNHLVLFVISIMI